MSRAHAELKQSLTDGLADVVMIRDGFAPPPGRIRPESEHGQVADFLFGPEVSNQQAGEPMPGVTRYPVWAGFASTGDRITQDLAKTADPAVIGHDQVDDIGRLASAGLRAVVRAIRWFWLHRLLIGHGPPSCRAARNGSPGDPAARAWSGRAPRARAMVPDGPGQPGEVLGVHDVAVTRVQWQRLELLPGRVIALADTDLAR